MGRTIESYWLYLVRWIPSMVFSRGNSCMKRCMYRRISATLCQGWKANVVAQMYQNGVSKNESENHSSIRVSPSCASGVNASWSNESRWSISNPYDETSSTSCSSPSNRATAYVWCVSLNSSITSLTDRSRSSSDGIDSNRSHVHS